MRRRKLSRHHCDRCGRQLPEDRWIWSSWTKSRYCYVGEGCFGKKLRTRRGGREAPSSVSQPEGGTTEVALLG